MERVLPHSDPVSSTPPSALPGTAAGPVTPGAPASRRRRSDASRARSSAGRGLSRGAVLAALAAATIAFPVVDVMAAADPAAGHSSAGNPVAAVTGGPTAREVLSSATSAAPPTTLLAGGRVRELSSSVSRAVDREPLPGCDGEAKLAVSNGQVPSSELCTLWDDRHSLRGDAAVALSELNLAYRASFGRDLCLTDSYRPLAVQRRLAAQKPHLAAAPGRSNHGWGLAIDLCSSETGSSAVMTWLRDNGPIFGWDNPAWARRGGSGPYEPWHWEYKPGTTSLGTDWS